MRTILLIVFLWYTSGIAANGQYYLPQNKVWAMGKSVGIDFSNGTPAVIGTAMQQLYGIEEGCASVCDTNGNLLFYTEGTNVWNSAHTLMPNGILINGQGYNSLSATQAALIVPDPGNTNRYYLFSLTTSGSGNFKLFCNVVDRTLDNGLGDIDTTYPLRNVLISDSLTEKMVAVAGCNNNVWVLVRPYYYNRFEAYQVTNSGIITTPVVSVAGNNTQYATAVGVLKVNHARNRLLAVNTAGGGAELHHFNSNTGIVSNTQTLDTVSGYGATFSPDDSKVYIQQYYPPNHIYQYNLTAPNPSATKISLGTGFVSGCDMRLGPDNKIYFASKIGYYAVNFSKYISRINFPNNLGTACGLQDSVPGLNFQSFAPNTGLRRGLPNIVVVAMPHTELGGNIMDTVICDWPGTYQLQAPATATVFQWDNGSTQPQRMVTQRGAYWVRYNTGCQILTDTFNLLGEDLPALTLVLNNNILSTTNSFNQYQWYKNGLLLNGATMPTFSATGNGWYSVKVSNSWGCSDSAAYEVVITGINALDITSQVKAFPNPLQNTIHISAPVAVKLCLTNVAGKILKETNKPELDVSTLAAGLYLLRISDKEDRLLKVLKVAKERN